MIGYIFILLGLAISYAGLWLIHPIWLDKLLHFNVICRSCRAILDEQDLKAQEERERFKPRMA